MSVEQSGWEDEQAEESFILKAPSTATPWLPVRNQSSILP